MHTEEEAKKKWCPMVRDGEGYTFKSGDQEQSKQSSSNADAKCRASDCMMWRWELNYIGISYRHPEDRIRAVEKALTNGTAPGYCGLAGRIG